LAAFSARIDAAHAFGLVGDDDAADMHVVRRIRNEFAHQLHGLTFSAQRIADLTKNIRCVSAYERANPAEVMSPRGRFIAGVAFLGDWLLSKERKRRRRPPQPQSASTHYGWWSSERRG
jgi:hypothetical protein